MLSEASKERLFTIDKGQCRTSKIRLIGGGGWSMAMPSTLMRLGLANDIANHLAHNYGDKSLQVASIALSSIANNNYGNINPTMTMPMLTPDTGASANTPSSSHHTPSLTKRLANGYPFIEAEVVYAVKNEYAVTAVDVIAHRTRLAFLNCDAAWHALPRIINIMTALNGWDSPRIAVEYQRALRFLSTMNRSLASKLPSSPENAVIASNSAGGGGGSSVGQPKSKALEIQPFVNTAHHLP